MAKLADVKKLEWSKCFVTRNIFDGAILEVLSETEEKIAIMFGENVAYVVADEEGTYPVADLVKHIVKDETIPHLDARFEGAYILASFDMIDTDSSVVFNEKNLHEYALDTVQIREEIQSRLELFQAISRQNAEEQPSM